jgi:putative ABC transport system ATP-binding protein
MTARNSIRVAGLVVEYPTADGPLRALDCRDLFVAGGTSVAVTGRSGCGKSTLLGLLAGLASPTQGSVTIGDTDITALSEPDRVLFRRSELGVVYQADNLLPFLTVAENIALQLSLSRNERARPERGAVRDDIDALLARLGLGSLGARLPDELSGGQRQRVAVARAVVHRPSVILADEPTGALDAANAHGVIELLVDLQCELGATLVVVTHDPVVPARLGRTVELRDGAVVADREASHAA